MTRCLDASCLWLAGWLQLARSYAWRAVAACGGEVQHSIEKPLFDFSWLAGLGMLDVWRAVAALGRHGPDLCPGIDGWLFGWVGWVAGWAARGVGWAAELRRVFAYNEPQTLRSFAS